MKGGPNKVILDLMGKPILSYPLAALESSSFVNRIVMVVSERDRTWVEEFLEEHSSDKVVRPVIIGGEERFDSVWNGLESLKDKPPEVVLVQDGARPFLSEEMIRDSINALQDADGAIVSVPATDTIKEVDADRRIVRTLNRSTLWCAQTPQTFKYAKLHAAYKSIRENSSGERVPTDDGTLVEQAGGKVVVVEGSYGNIKVTTPLDLAIAEAILRRHEIEN